MMRMVSYRWRQTFKEGVYLGCHWPFESVVIGQHWD